MTTEKNSKSSFLNNDVYLLIGETKGHLSSSAYERSLLDFNKIKNFFQST